VTIGILNEALRGMQQNQRRFERAADEVVRATTVGQDPQALENAGIPQPDFSRAALEMMTAKRGFEACLSVSRCADEMLGTLLDVLA